jgi:protein-arginine kinase activator protein McsA
LETARKKLQAAIDDERYEDAARLRDEIKQMEQKA